jgi:hypothetical protein
MANEPKIAVGGVHAHEAAMDNSLRPTPDFLHGLIVEIQIVGPVVRLSLGKGLDAASYSVILVEFHIDSGGGRLMERLGSKAE